ncbi:hypothetical protein [Candidatus Poriferisocius sp.]|uniref:hypothetical protein n=1 Tax=Candidatus Poriferisocius sp. TaxID=3101276 RepID=UPI003B5A9FD8
MAELAPQTGILFLSEQTGLTRQATHKRIDRVAPTSREPSAFGEGSRLVGSRSAIG